MFLDSYQLLASPLANLADNLPKSECKTVKGFFKTDENVQLMSQKGYLTYKYLNDFSSFDKKGIPEMKHYSSKLTDQTISDDEYSHVQRV